MNIKRSICNILSFILIVFSTGTLDAQELPVVGLALNQHVGDITGYDYSPMTGLLATVSYDRCLKIWNVEDYSLLATVNVPEMMSGGYLTECMFHPFNQDVVLVSGKTSSYVKDERKSDGKVYFFYAMDWKRNIMLDKFGFFEKEVSSISVSPDKNRMIVSSGYEKIIVYDTITMAVESQIELNDEYIYSTRFIDDSTFVISSDMYITKYSLDDNGSFGRCGRLSNRRYYDSGCYLSDNQILFTWSDRIVVIDLNKMKRIYKKSFKDKSQYGDLLNTFLLNKEKNDSLQLDMSSLRYRAVSNPDIRWHDGKLIIEYDGNEGFKLTRTGLDEIETIVPEVKSSSDSVWQVVYENKYQFYQDLHLAVPVGEDWIYCEYDIMGKGSDKGTYYERSLPAPACCLYSCPNNDYVVASLEDGTVRFYDTDTGKEHLALFIDKDGNWIIWTPTGFYYSDDVRNGAMIEWRYQQFSQVVVKKPLERRDRFFSLSMINKVLDVIFTPGEDVVSYDDDILINEFRTDIPKIAISDVRCYEDDIVFEYTISDYDVFKYGSYDLEILVDGKYHKDVKRSSYMGGGVLSVCGVKDYEEIMVSLMCRGKQMDFAFHYPDAISFSASKLALVACGVSEFDRVHKLEGTVSDAMDIDELARTGRLFGVHPMDSYSRLLLDKNVSLHTISATFDSIADSMDDSSVTIFYYSGHGVDKDGKYYLLEGIGRDGNSGLMAPEDIYAHMADIPGKKLIILDACYSERAMSCSNKDFAFLLSSGADQVSVAGSEISGSVFTRILKNEILESHASGRTLMMRDLFEVIVDKVALESDGIQIPMCTFDSDWTKVFIVK